MSETVVDEPRLCVTQYCGPENPQSDTRIRWEIQVGTPLNSRVISRSYEQMKALHEAIGKSLKNAEFHIAQQPWSVYKDGKHITTVYFNRDCDADYVKRSLIEHDGYSPTLVVLDESIEVKPCPSIDDLKNIKWEHANGH